MAATFKNYPKGIQSDNQIHDLTRIWQSGPSTGSVILRDGEMLFTFKASLEL